MYSRESVMTSIRKSAKVDVRTGRISTRCSATPGYAQSDLYLECYRIAEQRNPDGHQETQSVPDG